MDNRVYDILKFVAQIVLPALGTLVFAVFSLWNIPYSTEVVGTITAIDAFLGAVLQISSKIYYKENK